MCSRSISVDCMARSVGGHGQSDIQSRSLTIPCSCRGIESGVQWRITSRTLTIFTIHFMCVLMIGDRSNLRWTLPLFVDQLNGTYATVHITFSFRVHRRVAHCRLLKITVPRDAMYNVTALHSYCGVLLQLL